MSFLDLARSDNQAILEMEGDVCTLTAPEGEVYANIPCRLIRRGATRDLEGIMVVGGETVVTISILALADAGIPDPEALKERGWSLIYSGQTYRLGECPADYANGVVTAFLKLGAAA